MMLQAYLHICSAEHGTTRGPETQRIDRVSERRRVLGIQLKAILLLLRFVELHHLLTMVLYKILYS